MKSETTGINAHRGFSTQPRKAQKSHLSHLIIGYITRVLPKIHIVCLLRKGEEATEAGPSLRRPDEPSGANLTNA